MYLCHLFFGTGQDIPKCSIHYVNVDGWPSETKKRWIFCVNDSVLSRQAFMHHHSEVKYNLGGHKSDK